MAVRQARAGDTRRLAYGGGRRRMSTRMQRVDEMTEPPVLGAWYLVPCVEGEFYGRHRWWPVMGPKHNDREFFAFEQQHFHFDGRFLAPRIGAFLAGSTVGGQLERAIAGWVLMVNLGSVTYRKRQCHRVECAYDYPGAMPTFSALWAAFAGRTCERDDNGSLICPHRRAPLGSLVGHDGIVRCPLHGLRINVATGIVCPR